MKYIYSNPNNSSQNKITVFSIPKPFSGHIGIIQYNAIASWTRLKPKPEIIIFGDEQGTKEICEYFNLIHIPHIQRNKFGTPLLDGIFAQVHRQASTKIIAYLNADIILLDDFISAIRSVSAQLIDYLLIGRRWNVDLARKLEHNPDWEFKLTQLVKTAGSLADCDCKDYFVFPRHLFDNIPAFALGRGYWDTWMVLEALKHKYPVVDGSLGITAIHQNHAYNHIRGGKNEAYMGQEAQLNKKLGGNITLPGDIARATWQLKPEQYQKLPHLTVVVIVRNKEQNIERTLLSILIQSYQNREIVILDRSGDRYTESVIQPYLNEVSYHRLDSDNADIYRSSLEIARGELITFLDADSVLVAKILDRQMQIFDHEASTLDILLSGCRHSLSGKIAEYKPWEKLSSLKDLHPAELALTKEILANSAIVMRRARLLLAKDFNPASKPIEILDVLIHLIFKRGCKVNWLKEIARIDYIE